MMEYKGYFGKVEFDDEANITLKVGNRVGKRKLGIEKWVELYGLNP